MNEGDEDAWETCLVCRERPTSLRVAPEALESHLPRGWRPLGTQRAVAAWAAELPCCIECGTCWFVWYDAATELLEATAPLPAAAEPLLTPGSGLKAVLPLVQRPARGARVSWVHERIDALLLAWFAAAPFRFGTAAVGLLHTATAAERASAERETALRALAIVIDRARTAGDALEGDWIELLADTRLRTSGPATIEALRAALEAGLAPPPVLRCTPELQAKLEALRTPPAMSRTSKSDLAARIRSAFRL